MSSRRRQARTDETTLSEGLERNIELEGIVNFAKATGLTLDEALLESRDEQFAVTSEYFSHVAAANATKSLDLLRRTLSINSVLSTNSSFAERMEALRRVDPKSLKLTEIGRGSFGTVYEIPGTEWCLKKTLSSPPTLWLEFANGKTIEKCVNGKAFDAILTSETFPGALMPRVPQYLCSYGMADKESAERWFKDNGHQFPIENGGQRPGPIICLERIMPLPHVIRENLIRHYFKVDKQEAALADVRNKACICRAYLGCTSAEIAADKQERELETLRNFPLYLDQLKELDMNPLAIAQEMALGLAAGHWAASVDMLDVEYVIGSRPHTNVFQTSPLSDADLSASRAKSTRRVRDMGIEDRDKRPSFRHRAIQLWMIGFNKVSEFDGSVDKDYKKNIKQLVSNTRSTDGPYYPRVLAKTEEEWMLWLEFSRSYIRASKVILTKNIESSRKMGLFSHYQAALILKRPAMVMNKWMEAEMLEYNVSSKDFMKRLEDNKWEMPSYKSI